MGNNNMTGGNKSPLGNAPSPRFNMMWVWGIIAAGLVIWSFMSPSTAQSEITWRDFSEKILPSGNVEKIVVVNQRVVEIYVKHDKIAIYQKEDKYKNIPESGAQFYFTVGALEKFQNDYDRLVEEKGLINAPDLTFVEKDNGWSDIIFNVLIIAAMIGFWIFIMRRMSGGGGPGGVMNVGKSKARIFDKENDTKVTFKDVAGLGEAKVEVMEVVDFLKNPQKYSELGGKIPKGALLVGPPGTGKTLLAKAVAGEANVPFFSMSGSDFVEMFVGVGASRVRDLFKQAKDKAPCIVFIDEIDAIGRARSKNNGWSSNDERENTLNQLLTEMDGFGTNAGVIILAATNRADILDKALLRAGRFDRQIQVDLPEIKEREAIFGVHLQKLKLDPALDTAFLAKQTPGFSGADIANVCNEAALIAARNNKAQVEKQDFLDAIDRIIGGLERKNKVYKEAEKRAIAYHEAGHATVSWFLKYAHPLIKVTIIPRGKALGAAWYLPDERQITTREQLTHEMASLLGGRAAEDLVFGQMFSGALNDLERTSKMAYAMIAYYGMSEKLGNVSYFDSSGQAEMAFSKPYSENTAIEIDREVKALIDDCYAIAKNILKEHRQGLDNLANMLFEREVIFTEDLEEIFGKRETGE
ncbi:Cell division protein FtsH [Mucinivorans hirudinis]|uniref:ATP-dependent zinc metalloprotease FtsH n=1 Tax=Mucinivorans hirudinis TaxID=1433126 RepID=A0A060RDV2_9BACT|nr:Cell division protein FtsH [Mucinivorans hirudinis]